MGLASFTKSTRSPSGVPQVFIIYYMMTFIQEKGDSFKMKRDRLDFPLTQATTLSFLIMVSCVHSKNSALFGRIIRPELAMFRKVFTYFHGFFHVRLVQIL